MMRFDDPGPVALMDTCDQSVKNDRGEPVVLEFLEFALGRIGEAAFTEGLTGIDAAIMALETKQELQAQRSAAAQRGYWLLEDERGRRLQKAVAAARLNPMFLHCLVPHLRAVRDAKPFTEAAQSTAHQ